MYSNIKVYQKYLATSIKVGCATRSLYARSGPKAEGVWKELNSVFIHYVETSAFIAHILCLTVTANFVLNLFEYVSVKRPRLVTNNQFWDWLISIEVIKARKLALVINSDNDRIAYTLDKYYFYTCVHTHHTIAQ